MIKAIETQYRGYRFRSRLEARWAVFLDALGVEWEYEKEGYDLESAWLTHNVEAKHYKLDRPDTFWYLPDFWLPKQGFFVEIKPRLNNEFSPDRDTEIKARLLGKTVVVMGSPSCVETRWGHEAAYTVFAYGDEQHLFGYCPKCKTFGEGFCGWAERICSDSNKCGYRNKDVLCYSEPMIYAYRAAMSARFEHGETPRI